MARLWQTIGWRRVLVTTFCLAAWRALEYVPVTGLNSDLIDARLFSLRLASPIHAIGAGPPFATYSIAFIGLTPYITALMAMTVIEGISARVHAIGRTPEGWRRLQRWTRAIAITLAAGQAFGWASLMESSTFWYTALGWLPRLLVVAELTGGTVLLILLADLIDEFGLGFGYGAFLIYVLGPVAIQVQRLAFTFSSEPSIEALFRPIGIWLVFSIGVVAASVAVLLAVRRVKGSVDLKILMSGVIRPPVFAQTLLALPVYYTNYAAISNPSVVVWIRDSLTPYGPNPWTNVAFVVVEAALIIGFTIWVVTLDFRWSGLQAKLRKRYTRLAFIGGSFLALAVVVVPVLDWNLTIAEGRGTPVSGLSTVLVAAVILAIVGRIEAAAHTGKGLLIQMSPLP